MDNNEALQIYRVGYQLHHEAREHDFELPVAQLRNPDAALHLLQLHFGDGENSLLMPNAEASAEQILAQAALMGITHIQVHTG